MCLGADRESESRSRRPAELLHHAATRSMSPHRRVWSHLAQGDSDIPRRTRVSPTTATIRPAPAFPARVHPPAAEVAERDRPDRREHHFIDGHAPTLTLFTRGRPAFAACAQQHGSEKGGARGEYAAQPARHADRDRTNQSLENERRMCGPDRHKPSRIRRWPGANGSRAGACRGRIA